MGNLNTMHLPPPLIIPTRELLRERRFVNVDMLTSDDDWGGLLRCDEVGYFVLVKEGHEEAQVYLEDHYGHLEDCIISRYEEGQTLWKRLHMAQGIDTLAIWSRIYALEEELVLLEQEHSEPCDGYAAKTRDQVRDMLASSEERRYAREYLSSLPLGVESPLRMARMLRDLNVGGEILPASAFLYTSSTGVAQTNRKLN